MHTIRQQRVEALSAATLRALTGDGHLNCRGSRLHRGLHALHLYAPHLRAAPGCEASLKDWRAITDGVALCLLHSDPDVHAELCPEDPIERLVFELLEQLRVEALAPERLKGMSENLRWHFHHWYDQAHLAGLTKTGQGLMLYTLALMVWSRLQARPLPAAAEELMEATRAAIAPVLGTELAGLRRWHRDQRRFADHALAIARFISRQCRTEDDEAEDKNVQLATVMPRRGLTLLFDLEPVTSDVGAATSHSSDKSVASGALTYQAFTKAFDQEVSGTRLVRAALLREFRERLDARIAERRINVNALARLFRTALAKPVTDGWQFGEESGWLDGRILPQLVSTPSETRIFRREGQVDKTDAQVSFLVDCSGSMKDQIEAIAEMIDLLCRALDMAGVGTEVLGFTTRTWNGGRAYQQWLRSGQPADPGRLNELCHMVFKRADERWRRARRAFAALLKPDLFREGIDGEALDWACERLMAVSSQRRILVVVSDASPMDSATQLANGEDYLDRHLQTVIERRGRQGTVEILGLGIGLDLSHFYPASQTIEPDRALVQPDLNRVARFIAQGRPARR